MSTSGSINFNQTRNELIQDAYALIGVYGIGRTISSEDMQTASNFLNKMVKAYMADGLHLWAKEEAYLFVADNIGEYTLSGDSSSARACLRSDAVITELTAAAAASATTLSLVSTDMTVGDFIGVVGDDHVVSWTTIATIPGATSVTITTGLTSAAASGANVYTFTSRIQKPLRILSMRRVEGGPTSPNAISMSMLSQQEYFDIPSKNTNSQTTSVYYNPDLTTGRLYLYPRPADPNTYFEFTYERMLEDFDASTDNPDFPSEWLECLTYQLAVRLALPFGKSALLMTLKPMADEMYQKALSFDTEITSISFSSDTGN